MMQAYYVRDENNEIDITNYSMSWANTAGGIVSNGIDITNWLRGLFSGKILTKNEFSEFTKLVSIDDGQPINNVDTTKASGYGLGIMATHSSIETIDTIWWHSGGMLGYKTLAMWLPKQKIAITINYTRVKAGDEDKHFDPASPLAQSILSAVASAGVLPCSSINCVI